MKGVHGQNGGDLLVPFKYNHKEWRLISIPSKQSMRLWSCIWIPTIESIFTSSRNVPTTRYYDDNHRRTPLYGFTLCLGPFVWTMFHFQCKASNSIVVIIRGRHKSMFAAIWNESILMIYIIIPPALRAYRARKCLVWFPNFYLYDHLHNELMVVRDGERRVTAWTEY